MFRQFAQKIEEMRRLIDDPRSASLSDCAPVNSRETKDVPMGQGRFLLAVSGGMDSMCLLDLFSKVLDPSDYAIAHCNFSLRGEESDGDQALVEEHAARLGVRVFVKRFDTVAYAQEKGVSIEMAARDLRYGWFGQLCSEHGFNVLAVAHNANDNAETLMLNLLRGTGLNGLHGMYEVSSCPSCHFGHGAESVILFRPLLDITRKQIEGYVLAHRVPYRHDSSNFESDYKRNKIRNEVFPVFEKINPSFVRTLNREIGYFAEAGTIVDDWCRSRLPDVLTYSSSENTEATLYGMAKGAPDPSGRLNINIPALLATDHWRYLLYHILQPYGFNSQTLASVEDLLTSDRTISGKRFESPTHILLTAQETLMVMQLDNHSATVRRSAYDEVMVVRGSGIYNFNGTRFKVETIAWTDDMPLKQTSGILILDADKLKFPFVCRKWRQGDWFVPFGMRGRKKLSDLFADLKYDTFEKDSAIIMVDTRTDGLAAQQHVAGLLGVRIDDRYKVSSETTDILKITIL